MWRFPSHDDGAVMKFRFRVTQLAINLFLVGVLVFSMGGLAYFAASYTVDDLSAQLLDQSLSRVEQQAAGLTEAAQEQTNLHLELMGRSQVTAEDFPQFVEIWTSILETHDELTSLFITLEATGECLGVSRVSSPQLSVWQLTRHPERDSLKLQEYAIQEDRRELIRSVDDWKEYEIRERPWYLAAKSAKAPIWTETYPWIGVEGETAVQGVTYAAPLYYEGELVAVVSADIGLKQLSEFLQTVRIGERGYAFVLELREDGSHHVVAHPQTDLLVTAGDPGSTQLTPLNEFGDERVKSIVEHILANHEGTSPQSDEPPVRIGKAGESFLAQYKPFSGPLDGPNWIVCTVISEDEVMSRIHEHTLMALGLFLVVLAAVIGLSFYFSSQVSQPLEAMASEAKAIGSLQFEAKEPQHSVILEVDQLGRSIEVMKVGLRSFQKFVPSDLVESLLGSGQEAALGGELREITIFFSDLVGFTSISEQMQPEEVVELMREYLSAMSEEVANGGGTVDKYIGDAVMAFWGAPRIHADHAMSACQVALACQAGLRELNRKWQLEGKPALEMRIGLHTGEAIVGNIGSEKRLNYTVMGDAVNLTSRLEGLNKHYSTKILISEHTYRAAPGILARPLDVVSVKGKSQPVLVYELLDKDASDAQLVELAQRHTLAWQQYRAQDWEAAIKGFEQVLVLKPDDAPAQLALHRCREYQKNPPGRNWDGVLRMETK